MELAQLRSRDDIQHRCLIKPVSKMMHIKVSMMKRFMKFVDKLSITTKLRTYALIKADTGPERYLNHITNIKDHY